MAGSLFDPPPKRTPVRVNTLAWVFEALEREPAYARRKMFGCEAAYLDERLHLLAADRGGSFDGLLVCTSQEHHPSLMAAFPGLHPHPELRKWLYLPQSHEDFEALAAAIVSLARARDARIGVAPRPKKRRLG
ncbi:hypothetical protein [Bordetella avium]|uniref:MmcQ/YjbR family DNA-binding protein n=1 Tax=Bordetella avium (strain 197N) TaxID=360910 RepID=Q2KWR1_BORA1|nr:hypothetical protein [Bordetella avium]AZY48313.1 hypothetical protein C0J09_03550 [Bordetella avium]AZY51696.1 hypothetical protein C0J07_03600 [Bordetella avium]RIQ13442.1 hypothetical protein D0432_09500 [Bordetella avium]RIQ16602.1 hypothetical protein D0850_14590 [Bordetella avium]RIQ31362.1 hypothetical protein D0849_14690 [Bordetella avium]